MQKQIHVNSYIKRDGTQVKEHFRNIDTDNYGTSPIVPEYPDDPVIDEQDHNLLEDLFPNIFKPMSNMDSAPVLQGGVSVDVGFPTGGGIGDVLGSIGGVLGTVVFAGLALAPIALQMYQAMNSGNRQTVEYLKPQFDTKIKQLDTQITKMKTNIDNNITKLVNAKNQVEYSKIYEPLQKDWQAYQQSKNIVNNIKVHANNGDFQSVANDLGNFVSGKLNQLANPMNPNPQAIENIYNGLSTSVQNTKPRIDKILDVYKSSKGPLEFINNYANYHRPEARQLMNLSLNLSEDTYSNSEYSMIQPIFNEKLNEYLHRIGTNLKVTKNMKGIIFDKSSSISQKLSNFKQLQKDIRVKYNQDAKFISGLGISTDTNLQYSVGHFTILNPRIENGIFKGELFDIYNFEYISQEEFEKFITYLYNTGAYYLQELQRLENYYFLIPIEFEW